MLEQKGMLALSSAFEAFQDIDIESFSKSLPYYLMTGRRGLKVFQNENTMVCIAKHPHDEDSVLIFPEINGDYSLTVQVLNRLSSSGLNVQLARYTHENRKQLGQAVEANALKLVKSIKLKEEDILDWKYPVRILDTVKVSKMSGKKLKGIRHKFNRAADDYEVLPLSHPEAVKAIRASVLLWASGMIFAGNETGYDMTEFYDTLVKHIVAFPSLFDGFAVTNGKEALGFSVWDYTGDTANSLASLSRRSIDGMSEFQKVTACRMLSDKGIKRFNLGGSETDSLDYFKMKFQPCDSISISSYKVEFEPMSPPMDSITNAVKSNDRRFDSL